MTIVALEDLLASTSSKQSHRITRGFCKATRAQTKRLRTLCRRMDARRAVDRAEHRLEMERATLSQLRGAAGLRWEPAFLMFACARSQRQVERLTKRIAALKATASV